MDEVATQQQRKRRVALTAAALFATSFAGYAVALLSHNGSDDLTLKSLLEWPVSGEETTMQFNPKLPLHIQNLILEARQGSGKVDSSSPSFVRRNTNNKQQPLNNKHHKIHINNNPNGNHHDNKQRKLSQSTTPPCIEFYHISILQNEPNTCTNSGHYPPEWTSDRLIDYMFHSSGENCCEEMLKPWTDHENAPGEMPICNVVDMCLPWGERCEGKEFNECVIDEQCQFDITGNKCVALHRDNIGGSESLYQNDNTVEGESSRCEGKWMMECAQDRYCRFDEDSHSCVELGGPLEITGNVNGGAGAPENECSGHAEWLCLADPRCDFDITSQTCVMRSYDTTATNNDIGGNGNSQTTTTNVDACQGKKKKECLRFGCQFNNYSKTCYTPTSPPTPHPTNTSGNSNNINTNDPCATLKYHPTSVTERTCSNNNQYPSLWKSNPDMISRYFFDSASECCAAFYGDGRGCVVEDICNPSTTDNGKSNPDGSTGQTKPAKATTATTSCYSKTNSKKSCKRDVKCTWDKSSRTCMDIPTPPTEAPTFDCADVRNQRWHMSTELTYTCTNNGNYPSDLPTYPTADKCCTMTFPGKPCHIDDICFESYPPTTPIPTTLQPTLPVPTESPVTPPPVKLTVDGKVVDPNCYVGKEWHKSRKLGDEEKCTNDNNISQAWLHPAIRPYYLFMTAAECCKSNFDIPNCELVDVCIEGTDPPTYQPTTAPPTLEPYPTYSPIEVPPYSRAETSCNARWHISEDRKRTNTCTNDANFPEEWKDPAKREHFLFRTAADCCNALFPNEEECNLYNICPDNVPTVSPTTEAPTTKRPSRKPTPEPTRKPTPRPVVDADWYNDRTIGKCVQDCEGDYPCGGKKSEWDLAYHSVEACCKSMSWKEFDECAMTPSPTAPPPPTYEPTDWRSSAPTPRPTPRPVKPRPTPNPTTKKPTISSAECAAYKWHMSTQDEPFTCTNDPQYPKEWDNMAKFFLHADPETCCSKAFGDRKSDCKVRHFCGGKTNGDANGNVNYSVSGGGSGGQNPACADSKGWHMSTAEGESMTCTNDDKYPSPWDQNVHLFFKDTKDACCKAFYNGADCKFRDICGGSSSTSSSGSNQGPAPTPALPEHCSEWHMSIANGETMTCTNSEEYPPPWKQNAALHFYSTSDACCQAKFGGVDCKVKNVCDNPAPVPTPAQQAPTPDQSTEACDAGDWHMSIAPGEAMTCTNSDRYPKSWEHNRANMFFSTSDACCQAKFKGVDCNVKDICSSSNAGPGSGGNSGPAQSSEGCTGGDWHMSTEVGEDMTCTNDDNYPPAWRTNEKSTSHFFHSTSEACCNKFYGGRDCNVRDICSSGTSQNQQADSGSQGSGADEVGFVTLSDGVSEDFEGQFQFRPPWIVGNPPQWKVDTTESVSGTQSITNVLSKELAATRTMKIKVNLARSAGFICKAKIDTSMPFDRFELHVNGEKRKSFYQRQDNWINLSEQLPPGDNEVQFKVVNGDMFPKFERDSMPSKYGTGHVWIDDCFIHI